MSMGLPDPGHLGGSLEDGKGVLHLIITRINLKASTRPCRQRT